MKKMHLWMTLAIVLMAAAGLHAQDNTASSTPPAPPPSRAPGHFYHLDFVVRETDGSKVISSRTYSTFLEASSGQRCRIRAGAQVPVVTGSFGTEGKEQIQTIELNTEFDCDKVVEADGKLNFLASASVSSIERPDVDGISKHQPVVRENRWDANVTLLPGKPTLIFSSDDVAVPGRKIQVEVTATPLK